MKDIKATKGSDRVRKIKDIAAVINSRYKSCGRNTKRGGVKIFALA